MAGSVLASQVLTPADRAFYLAWAGQPDSAFALLDRTQPRMLASVLQNPAFDRYRRHPGYLALRHRLGLDR